MDGARSLVGGWLVVFLAGWSVGGLLGASESIWI
jgi:hypothetical protein